MLQAEYRVWHLSLPGTKTQLDDSHATLQAMTSGEILTADNRGPGSTGRGAAHEPGQIIHAERWRFQLLRQ